MKKLERAILRAYIAHLGQIRDSGEPYFCHVMRVMQNVLDTYDESGISLLVGPNYLSKEDCAIIAVLHDTLEDTDLTYSDIHREFGDRIAFSVLVLSRIEVNGKKPTYEEFIRNIKEYPGPTLVKMADLKDNMRDISSLPVMKQGIIERYKKAEEYLRGYEE